MRRQGGSFGLVILVVVVAIVLLLATRAWKSVMPTAAQVARPAPSETSEAQDAPQPTPEGSSRPANMPDLRQMKRSTDGHSGQVQEALKASD